MSPLFTSRGHSPTTPPVSPFFPCVPSSFAPVAARLSAPPPPSHTQQQHTFFHLFHTHTPATDLRVAPGSPSDLLLRAATPLHPPSRRGEEAASHYWARLSLPSNRPRCALRRGSSLLLSLCVYRCPPSLFPPSPLPLSPLPHPGAVCAAWADLCFLSPPRITPRPCPRLGTATKPTKARPFSRPKETKNATYVHTNTNHARPHPPTHLPSFALFFSCCC